MEVRPTNATGTGSAAAAAAGGCLMTGCGAGVPIASTSLIASACRASIPGAFPGDDPDLEPDFHPARPFILIQIVTDNRASFPSVSPALSRLIFLVFPRIIPAHSRACTHFLTCPGCRRPGEGPQTVTGAGVSAGQDGGAAGHDGPGGGGGEVQHCGVPGGAVSPAMMAAVRAACLAVSSISMAQTCPAYGLAATDGHQISASGRWVPAAGPLRRMRRSDCHHGRCCCQCRAGVRAHSRTASTARTCCQAGQAGRAGAGRAGRWRPCRPG